MRQCRWNAIKKKEAAGFKPKQLILQKSVSESELLQAVTDGRFFGYLSVDIHIPEHLFADIDWLNITHLFDRRKCGDNKNRLMFVEKAEKILLFR